MYVIRRARVEDVSTLLKLAKMVHFINLPPDRDVIASKVSSSRSSFQRAAGPGRADERKRLMGKDGHVQGLAAGMLDTDLFMFVLENSETGTVLGTSQVAAHMGGPGNPNYAFKLVRKDFFADDIKTGTSHIVARLYKDESAPTEIGGLILQPASRGANLGRLLSFVRFHFIAMRRDLFADRVLAEMMAPITDDGRNLLWEFLGRRFIPLSYTEADTQCQRSRRFIAALLPHEDIYLSLLPPEARDVVGNVHRETVPARRMLEKLGFAYKDSVDPFDGGPHLEALTDEIPLVRMTGPADVGQAAPVSKCKRQGIVSMLHADGEFRAVFTQMGWDSKGRVQLPANAMEALKISVGDEVGVTDLTDGVSGSERSAAKPARRKTAKKTKRKTSKKKAKV